MELIDTRSICKEVMSGYINLVIVAEPVSGFRPAGASRLYLNFLKGVYVQENVSSPLI